MIRVLILCVVMTGCGVRQMNVGADRPVLLVPEADLAALCGVVPPRRVLGAFDRRDGTIRLTGTQPWLVAHEVGEALAYELGPRVWTILNRYHSASFPCGEDGLH